MTYIRSEKRVSQLPTFPAINASNDNEKNVEQHILTQKKTRNDHLINH